MTHEPTPRGGHVGRAASGPRPPRRCWHSAPIAALVLLVLTVAVSACGATTQGATSLPTIAAQSGIVCDSPARSAPGGGCVVQDAATGIALRVTNAYADATSTIVQMQTTNTAGYPLMIREPQLALASGRTFQGGGCGGSPPSCLMIYPPVAPADSAPLVHFVASAHFRAQYNPGGPDFAPTPTPMPASLTDLDQLALSVHFALAPVRSRGDTYQQAPTVKQGIGVQAPWLQVSPAANEFYGPAGGASLEVVFTGLPANMELLSFLRIQFQNHIGGGTTGDSGPGSVDLTIPGMSVSTPEFTFLQSPPLPSQDSQVPFDDVTIGAAGTAQLEVSYQGSGTPTGQPATVSISDIQLLTGGIDGNSGNPPTLPSYQITLPLS